MPNWKKIIVSGSDASLNSVFANSVTASIFSGSFTGSLQGTSSWSNNSISSSYALSASWAPGGTGGGGLATKAGSIASASFAGNPRTATVTFSTPFTNANYSITVTGEDSRAWSVQSKVSGSFVVNANSNVALTGTTYWQAVAYGETT
jgi:hypothetical protein